MGISNIHILMEKTLAAPLSHAELDLHKLIVEHRKGKHPYGSMRRDCPLCQR